MKSLCAFICLCLLPVISACSQPAKDTPPDPVAESTPLTMTPVGETVSPATELLPTPEDTVVAQVAASPTPEPLPTPGEVGPLLTPSEIEQQITFLTTQGGDRRDRGINLLQTNDGGYAIVGYTSSQDAIQEDVYLVRLNHEGDLLWSNTYGGEGIDNGWDILETEDGGFIITGFTDSFGAGEMDVYLLRVDAGGNTLWQHTFGGPESEFAWAMTQTTDGGYVLAGQTESFGDGDKDGYLVKVNDQGEELWSQTFGGAQEDRLFSIGQSGDGGFVMAGTTRSFGAGNRDAYLVKTDSSGNMVWMQVYGENQDDVAHAVRQTSDGGAIVTGYTKSFEAKNYDTWLLKTDEDGLVIWQNFYGSLGDDRTIYGEQTADGGYIMTGYTQGFGSSGWDVFLVKADSLGDVIWHQTFGGTADDTGYTVRQTADNGFILTGETYSFGEGAGDMLVIKVDHAGEITE